MLRRDNVSAVVTTAGGGFFTGILVGWALKKVVKLLAIIAGLFLIGMAILQHRKIASVNWDKLEQASDGAVNAVVNATANMVDGSIPAAELAITASISIGFTIGFMKG